MAATAASQKEFLEALTSAPEIQWLNVEAFHLDEYIGLPITHPGSFRKMLLEQLISKTGIVNYHLLDGDADGVHIQLPTQSPAKFAYALRLTFAHTGR